jgi:SAM-dependent methyltransferase
LASGQTGSMASLSDRSVHEVAREGFAEAERYERARPGYPSAAVAWLAEHLRLGDGSVVVDLAAGTGKLTRLLIPTGSTVVAVEPLEEMRSMVARLCPTVPVIAGAAERLPLRAGSVDAVTVAQAFHWFDADAAFAELRRVVRPGGRVGLIWNARDRNVAWVDAVWSVMDRVERKAPWRDHDRPVEEALGERAGFGPLSQATFHHEQPVTPEGMLDRFRSVSHVAVLPAPEQEAVLTEVREILASHFETKGRDELLLPYRVDCLWCERLADGASA